MVKSTDEKCIFGCSESGSFVCIDECTRACLDPIRISMITLLAFARNIHLANSCLQGMFGSRPANFWLLLHSFQIINRSGLSRYIDFTMYIDIIYIQVYSKNYVSRNARTTYNLEWSTYQQLGEFSMLLITTKNLQSESKNATY